MSKVIVLCRVREVAIREIEENSSYYPEALLQLIPRKLLEKNITDDNLPEISVEIDAIRFEKENELAQMLGLTDWVTDGEQYFNFKEIINSELNSLPEDQEKIRREIKFLFNVSAIIIHL